jgi:hypothetical protein
MEEKEEEANLIILWHDYLHDYLQKGITPVGAADRTFAQINQNTDWDNAAWAIGKGTAPRPRTAVGSVETLMLRNWNDLHSSFITAYTESKEIHGHWHSTVTLNSQRATVHA